MADMIERVAKVIGDHFYADVGAETTPQLWASCMEAARAAIEAMREPTLEMLRAGENVEIAQEGKPIAAWASSRRDFLADKWRAMIDDALTPSPPSQ